MRYILNDSGFIETISFDYLVECNNKSCTEYTGSVPTGYESLAEWSDNANINAYKIVNGNLTYDSGEDTRLQRLWVSQSLKEVTLYENVGGANGTITLNDNATNYKYLEIFFGNNTIISTRTLAINGSLIILTQDLDTNTGWFHIYSEQLRITDNQLVSEMSTRTDFNATNMATYDSPQMKVYKVIGYR